MSAKRQKVTRSLSFVPVRVLQWNVFEDGLTDAPGNLGFSADFDKKFSTALSKLSQSGDGRDFWGFGSVRDFTQLPAPVHIDSARAFFNFIDVPYAGLYHTLGGEARFGTAAPGDLPDLGNSLRTLFLRSSLLDSSRAPSSSNVWRVPDFEKEIEKISASSEVASRIRDLKELAFNPSQGVLTWDRSSVDGVIWKRQNNIWKNKWAADLSLLVAPPAVKPPVQDALSRLIHVTREGEDDGGAMKSLIRVSLNGSGEITRVKSLTLQAAVRWLLLQMCEHSIQNAEAGAAVAVFAGVREAPATAEARVAAMLPSILQAIDEWFVDAALESRSVKMSQCVEKISPDIATLVEYDEQWRRFGPPKSRRYAMVPGKGTAAIMFDEELFEQVEELDGIKIARTVPAISARVALDNGKEHKVSPKSSCIALLRRREDSALLLVTALHFESAPPSDTGKVGLRALQLRATLLHLSELAGTIAGAGHRLALVVGGDFNALPEEFVHGNGDAFWQAPGVMAVRPPLRRPATPAKTAAPPDPTLARFGEDGVLRLLCSAVDRGELREMTHNPEASCSRAGYSMVIDFVFAGTVGGLDVKGKPLLLATAEESSRAADKDYGIYNAVMRWGSDHLPVGCELVLEG